jgi:hypothetical protein
MTQRLTTLMHETARRVPARLQPPGELRRQAEQRRRARLGAAITVIAAVSVLAAVTITGIRTAQQPDSIPAQGNHAVGDPDWVPAQGNHAVGDWEITEGPTVKAAGGVTSGCKPAGSMCPGFYIELVAINRAAVVQSANTLTATGGYLDGSGEVWRAECRRVELASASQPVDPGQELRLYCDNAREPLESIENVDRASVKLIETDPGSA